ncbi:hypothetical protein TL16_g03984 [Triparma laevis f. inornata]|uniref:Uncharacterized protein n=1 Tax=Triparma laevis f. inornata TaxID=1714386 RepID=A0A9W7E388_9STRA|nr:hypothetical protein TL16_g03984 [Triparma laevis f. inornata]
MPPCVPFVVSQPLNHFGPSPANFDQHLCVVSEYFDANSEVEPSVFFNVGNESPLEEYVNNTGLMYTLAPKFNSLLVFAEHRYMGASVPSTIGVPDCLGYDTIAQALADYASIMSFIVSGGENKIPVDFDYDFSAFKDAPVITFGGSYGGMLSAYIRLTYPSLVTGAIAASAPTWGLPLSNPPIDAGASFVGHGMGDQCKANFKSGLVIINEIMKLDDGAEYLSNLLGLCSSLEKSDGAAPLLDYLQAPWFDLAEGNFPFPSSYIPFAVGPGNYDLPPWPVRAACESLDADFGVEVSGDVSDVKFSITSGSVGVDVDWNTTKSASSFGTSDLASTKIPDMLKGMVGAVNVWCNVTGEETCTRIGSCPTGRRILKEEEEFKKEVVIDAKGAYDDNNICSVDISLDPEFNCWPSMTCNDDLNLENALAQGLGNDIYWPPTVERGTTLESFLGERGELVEGCAMDEGLYGLPKTADNWSTRLDTALGGSSLEGYTNVVFSNGYLDPWASAGVFSGGWKPGDDAVIELGGGSVALMIEEGAHHLDLMFPTGVDPESVLEARQVEEDMIAAWIKEWGDNK